jgi:hypothetical protein
MVGTVSDGHVTGAELGGGEPEYAVVSVMYHEGLGGGVGEGGVGGVMGGGATVYVTPY